MIKNLPTFASLLFLGAILLSFPIALADTEPTAMAHPTSEEKIEEPKLEPEKLMAQFLWDKKNRVLLKRHTLELAPFVGPILGDALETSVIYGMRSNYHITENFAIGVDGGFTAAGLDPFTLGTVITGGDNDSYFVNGNFAWHFPTAYLIVKDHILRGDLFVTTGAGLFNLAGTNQPTGFIGGGTKVYFDRWVVLRIDVRNYIIPTNFFNKTEITSNALFMFGLSFFIPNRKPLE